jgi:hypothetical protein
MLNFDRQLRQSPPLRPLPRWVNSERQSSLEKHGRCMGDISSLIMRQTTTNAAPAATLALRAYSPSGLSDTFIDCLFNDMTTALFGISSQYAPFMLCWRYHMQSCWYTLLNRLQISLVVRCSAMRSKKSSMILSHAVLRWNIPYRVYSQPLVENSISPLFSTTPSEDGNLIQVTDPGGSLVLASALMTPESPNYYAPLGLCRGNDAQDSSKKPVYYMPGAVIDTCYRVSLHFESVWFQI